MHLTCPNLEYIRGVILCVLIWITNVRSEGEKDNKEIKVNSNLIAGIYSLFLSFSFTRPYILYGENIRFCLSVSLFLSLSVYVCACVSLSLSLSVSLSLALSLCFPL